MSAPIEGADTVGASTLVDGNGLASGDASPVASSDWGEASCLALAAALERGEVEALDPAALARPWADLAKLAGETPVEHLGVGLPAFLDLLAPGWCERFGGKDSLGECLWGAVEGLGAESTEGLVQRARAAGRSVRPGAAPPETTTAFPRRAGALGGVLVRLSDIPERKIEWFWPGRLAWANVAVMAGDGGVGKSTLVQMLAAGMTRGQAPPGGNLDGPRDVVILTSEEDPSAVIKPRMRLMGADESRVHVLAPDRTGPFSLPSIGVELAAFCADCKAGMVVVDTGPSFMDPALNGWREEHIRAFLEPLQRIGQQLRAVPVVLAHLNKASGASSRHRIMGGAAWVNAPRLALLVGAPPGEDARETGARMVAVEKSNLGVYPPAFSFDLVPAADDDSVAVVRWGEEIEGVRSSDLVAAPMDTEERSERADCMEALRDLLACGPMAAKDAENELAAQGYSKKTVLRARKDLGITREAGTVRQEAFRGPHMWTLPEAAEELSAQMTTQSDGGGHLCETDARGHLWENALSMRDLGMGEAPADATDAHSHEKGHLWGNEAGSTSEVTPLRGGERPETLSPGGRS